MEEASKRIMEYNKTVGIRCSVDGLFVLNQGFALHMDQNQTGWTTQRLQGMAFGCLTASRGQVLIKLQSIILKNLYLSGKTHPDGFDSYIAETGQGQREIASAKAVSDNEYIDQHDSESVIVRG